MRNCWQSDFKTLVHEPLVRLLEGEREICLRHEKLTDDVMISVTVGDRTIIRRIAAPPEIPSSDVLQQELASVETVYRSFRISNDLKDVEREALIDGPLQADTIGVGFGSVRETFNAYQQLVCDSCQVQEFARKSHQWPGRITTLMREYRLYFFRHERSWLLPKFQIHRKSLLPGLTNVCYHIPRGAHPLAVFRWFHLPHPDLFDVSPRAWLAKHKSAVKVASLVREI